MARLHHLGQVQRRLCILQSEGRRSLAYLRRADAVPGGSVEIDGKRALVERLASPRLA